MSRTELKVASTLLLLSMHLLHGIATAQQVALTWDDLPSHGPLPTGVTRAGIVQEIVKAMKSAGLPPAYGFVNGVRTEQEPGSAAALQVWRDAGYPLGNHTWSHISLNKTSVSEFEEDIVKNEPLLEQKMAEADWRWLRYPFLDEGETPEKKAVVRDFLAQRHYRVAAVTMSFGDFAWNEPYSRCLAKGNSTAIASLERSYLAAADASVTYARQSSHTLNKRDIPYVLLMHVGAFDARLLPRLLALYKERGFTFVTLQQAESDPFYRNDLDLKSPGSPDTLDDALKAHDLPTLPKTKLPAELATICP